ncbi:hypothetical protein F0919_11735 [Taibaiella lutea]|uniref:DUF4625 domain-containing protein n=1 Tax=Taibaiella lutea TaxID=2608001 RepID=A0A5M6CDN1_9BACT|nr:hypothetical protein [Taibaiella lutea]KAA5533211.1 hypothetical protein F0919_11735 [Taibaiella lutea]
MKTFLFVLIVSIVSIFIFSCSKKEEPKVETFTYSVEGVHDLTMSSKDSISMPISISRLTGTAEEVKMQVRGVLSTHIVLENSYIVGTPDFATSIGFHAANAPVGEIYQLALEFKSASTEAKIYNFSLKVVP